MGDMNQLKRKLAKAQADLANATAQSEIEAINLQISHLKAYIRDAESAEWHGNGWASRERNA